MLKLIGSVTSPYVRKVRIVLAEKKIDYQFVTEDVWSASSKIADVNPLAKVPVLMLDADDALFDSRVIVDYLDSSSPAHRLIPAGGRERINVKRWEALADGLLDAAILIRLERTHRPSEQQSAAWVDRQQQKIDHALALMARELHDKAWCEGVGLTLADVAVGCALGYLDFRFSEQHWRDRYPNLARLAEKLAQRSSFKDTLPPV